MAVTVTHQKVSAIADDPVSSANGEVLPSDWNATHTVSGLATVAESGDYGDLSGTPDDGTIPDQNGFYPDISSETKIWRFVDRVFIGEGVEVTGNRFGSQGSIIPTGPDGASFTLRDSQLNVISSYGLMAINGVSRSSDQADIPVAAVGPAACIAVSGVVINDKASGVAWGLYSDLQHESGAGSTFGLEVAAKNKGDNVDPTPYSMGGNGVYGVWLAGGGDSAYGGEPTNPSAAAIAILGNAGNWNKGIVFRADALQGTDGVTGAATAISMARGHTILWRGPSNVPGLSVRSDIDLASSAQSVLATNTALQFYNNGAKRTFQLTHDHSGVNFVNISGATTTNGPTIAAAGDDTNIDLIFDAKGSGLIKFADAIAPATHDAVAQGTTALRWSDAWYASGAVLTFGAASTLDCAITHATGSLTVSTGDLRVTTAGTNAASVVTTGGTQELDNKTLDSSVGKGTWTASGTWTLPAFTLGGTVTSNGQSFSGTIANLGTVTTADINGGTVDGTVIGGASAAAGTFTSLNANGGGALTGTWSNLGTVTTIDINGGTIDGTTIGATTPAAGTLTGLTVYGGAGIGFRFGSDGTGNTLTDATDKIGRAGTPHYTNAEEPLCVFTTSSGSTTNTVNFGGGSGLFNAANILGFYTGATNTTTTGTERLRINSAGNVFINDTANGDVTLGLTINQGGNDNQILALKSSDVAHGVTSLAETDTFGYLMKADAAAGGLRIVGLAEDATVIGLQMIGVGDSSTTKSTAATGMIVLDGQENDGDTTPATNATANSNLLAVRDNTTTRFILDSDGDSHQDVGTAWTTFDHLDDIATLNALAYNVARPSDPIKEKFGEWMADKRDLLEAQKIVRFNENGHHFVNMSKLAMLHTGAIRQLGERLADKEARLIELEAKLARLETKH
jgi:hypothetical protein